MNSIWIILSFLLMVCSDLCVGAAVNDTISATRKFSVNLSSAFLNSSNWNGSSFSSFSTTVNSDLYLTNITDNSNMVFTVKSDLGFTKFIDSIWNKHSDKLYAQLIWKKRKYKIDQSYTTSITAQLLNSYLYQYDPVLNTTSKTLSGTFFNPANFDAGYGIGISFWRNSMFNLSVASARIRIDPAENTSDFKNSLQLGSVKHGAVFFDYGFSLQILVLKEWKEKLEINSSGKFFIESFELSHLHMDMSHKINYSIWKWLQLRADIRMVYDPSTSMKMQYRNELLFGVFYEASKKFE